MVNPRIPLTEHVHTRRARLLTKGIERKLPTIDDNCRCVRCRLIKGDWGTPYSYRHRVGHIHYSRRGSVIMRYPEPAPCICRLYYHVSAWEPDWPTCVYLVAVYAPNENGLSHKLYGQVARSFTYGFTCLPVVTGENKKVFGAICCGFQTPEDAQEFP